MSSDSLTQDLPFGVGAAAGVAAWVLTYLFTYLLTASDIRDSPVRRVFELLGGELPTWKVVGWVFFNAHFVDTVFEGLFGGARSFIGGEGGFTPFLYVVPPVLLVVAGLAVGRSAGAGRLETGRAALVGATVAVGYLVLSVVGLLLFSLDGAAPDAVTAVLLAGIVYPLAFGAAGGVAANVTGEDGSL